MLYASNVPPLRHVLHVRLLWRPVKGAKADSPAATNASLHWYILGEPTSEGTSVIHYAGTAFVTVTANGPDAEVTIANGNLRFVERRGQQLVDPLKSFKISSNFDAVSDDAKVRQILTDVKSAMLKAK